MARAVETFADRQSFLAAARAFLERDEARHNLQLGLTDLFGVAPPIGMSAGYVVRECGEPVLAALRSQVRGLVLSGGPARAIDALAAHVADEGAAPPFVNGPEAAVAAFLERWPAQTGANASESRQRLHRLDAVTDLPRAPGAMRRAEEEDRALLTAWADAFQREIGTPELAGHGLRALDQLRLHVWTDGADPRPLAMAAWNRPTRSGCSIGLVYTPPALRGRGYASALVAALSRMRLEGGNAFCTLFTDLANPISNRIYARIGYAPLEDYRIVRLAAPKGAARRSDEATAS